jgi:hypothetical protein
MSESIDFTELLPGIENRLLRLDISIFRLMVLFALIGLWGAVAMAGGSLWFGCVPEPAFKPPPLREPVYFGARALDPRAAVELARRYSAAGVKIKGLD